MLAPGALKVLIVGADGLDKLVTVGDQQPYYILECGQQRSRSKPCVGNNCNPTWNTAHKFNINEEAEVLATVKDEVTKGIIGQGSIGLSRARQYGKDEGAAVLINLGGASAGTLRYKLKYQTTPGSVLVPQRGSESGSHASYDARSPADPSVQADEDPMLAAVTSQVSLAKAAMQQLTAELAELTGSGSTEQQPNAFKQQQRHQRHPPAHTKIMQERQWEAPAAAAQQQRSLRSVSMASSSPAAAASPSMSPHMMPAGSRDVAAWNGSWQTQGSGTLPPPAAAAAGAAELPSTEELLATYGAASAAVEQQERGAGLSSTKQLVQQLQEALSAAHTEKVAVEDELSSVKQAMAVMSKQHYLDMKRLRDSAAAGAAGTAGAAEPGHSIMTIVDSYGSPVQKSLASPKQPQQLLQQHQRSLDAGDNQHINNSKSGDGEDVSPVPAYKLQIQIHQLERQLAEQSARIQEEVSKQEAQAARLAEVQRQLDAQAKAIQQADANTRAAEVKAAEQATQAAAARSQLATALSTSELSSGRESALAVELAAVRSELLEATNEKSELEEALGLMEKNNLAQVAALQAELRHVQDDAASLRQVSSSEEVDYLQAQLRRTLRQVVELQHQVQVLQQNARQAALATDGAGDSIEEHMVIKSEHELLMQELVTTKLELAELKEQQLVTQRQLFKAQEILRKENI